MKKKLLALAMVICMLAIAVIGTTYAYFTDQTDTKTNTFTVGKVDIDLTEPEFDKLTDADKKITPEKTITKDPTITLKSGSEEAYILAKVEFSAGWHDVMDAETDAALLTKMTGYDASAWTVVEDTDTADGVIVIGLTNSVTAAEADTDTVLFTAIPVPGTATSTELEALGTNPTIKITAYAVQKTETINSVATAWSDGGLTLE